MQKANQKGLSLIGGAIMMAVVTLIAVGTLASWRYERNFFAETWNRLTGRATEHTVRQMKSAIKSEATSIRKCVVGGKIVYSNVECDTGNHSSQPVELLDTRGIEPPKPSTLNSEQDAKPDLREKMIEQVISR